MADPASDLKQGGPVHSDLERLENKMRVRRRPVREETRRMHCTRETRRS